MGITGLLPFLEKKKSSRPCNIKEFSGCTIAADAYCWLHKGAFACADKLARGEPTDMYVQYCMKYVNMLISHKVRPILVFDGRHLPAKALTEKKRRERRQDNRSQAAALLRQGRASEARTFLQRCVDVTHEMALALMRECRKINVDCIVAPYEADAQLAYFSLEGIADIVITEDSDLLLFGCKKVLFKLDLAGNGVLVEQEKLKLCMGFRDNCYSFDKFRYMCILSGCDYLDSLPGIGLTKACQFVSRTQDPDIHRALSRLPYQLNIKGLSVPMEYRDAFLKADAMFRHQLVFDPKSRKTKPLTPYVAVDPKSPLAGGPLPGCKPEFEDEQAFQLALGNLDPMTLKKVDDFDPDDVIYKSKQQHRPYWSQPVGECPKSIWGTSFFEEKKKTPVVSASFMEVNTRPVDHQHNNGKAGLLNGDMLKKRKRPTNENSFSDLRNDKMLALDEAAIVSLYTLPLSENRCEKKSPEKKKSSEENSSVSPPTSPILTPRRQVTNPFAQRNKMNANKKVVQNNCLNLTQSPKISCVQSSYFKSADKVNNVTSPKGKSSELTWLSQSVPEHQEPKVDEVPEMDVEELKIDEERRVNKELENDEVPKIDAERENDNELKIDEVPKLDAERESDKQLKIDEVRKIDEERKIDDRLFAGNSMASAKETETVEDSLISPGRSTQAELTDKPSKATGNSLKITLVTKRDLLPGRRVESPKQIPRKDSLKNSIGNKAFKPRLPVAGFWKQGLLDSFGFKSKDKLQK